VPRALLHVSRQEDEHHWRSSSLRPEELLPSSFDALFAAAPPASIGAGASEPRAWDLDGPTPQVWLSFTADETQAASSRLAGKPPRAARSVPRAPLHVSRREDEHHWRSSSLRPEALASPCEQHDQCYEHHSTSPGRRTRITGAAVAFDQKRWQASPRAARSVL
jgi:hypothetical protein